MEFHNRYRHIRWSGSKSWKCWQSCTFITGFSLNLPAGGAFSTSAQVTGNIYAFDYAAPTPTDVNTASNDMLTAYTDAAGRAPDFTELYAGDISGKTLVPGAVY